ncbi:hypothetical protein HG531_005011 [Fusarium graminearum]|nr:hypothetical protein HG531_005011 [Fusarium graminearum]
MLCNLGHTGKLRTVTSGKCFRTKTGPELGLVKFLRHLNSDIKVTALNSKVETSGGVLDKLEGDFGVALLLQIGNNGLANKTGVSNNVKHFLIVALDQSQLESVFCRINLEDAGLRSSIKAVHIAALDLDQVDGLIKGTDDTVIAVQKSVLDMVESRVQQNACIIPSSALDTNSLVESADLLKSLGHNSNIVLAQQSGVNALLLLNIVKMNSGGGDDQQVAGTSKVDVGSAGGGLEGSGSVVGEILDIDGLIGGVENGKSVTCNKNGRASSTSLGLGGFDRTRTILGQVNQFVRSSISWGRNQNRSFRRVEGQSSGCDPGTAKLLEREKCRALDVLLEIIRPDVLLLSDVEEKVLVHSRSRAFSLQLEDHNTVIVTSSKKIDLGMGCNNPEAVVLSLERLDSGSLVQVPDANSLVLSSGQNEVLVGVEKTSRRILKVSSACVDFPGLGLAHTP